jgi:hypothetical protein
VRARFTVRLYLMFSLAEWWGGPLTRRPMQR